MSDLRSGFLRDLDTTAEASLAVAEFLAPRSFDQLGTLLLVLPFAGGWLFLCFSVRLLLALHDRLRRHARHSEQRRFLAARDRYLDGLFASGTAGAAADAFAAAVHEREREETARWDGERRDRPGAPWLSGRATARRRVWLRRRCAAWLRWADAARSAAARGAPIPPEPGSRRSGAPIRRLCRTSVNPMPDIEAVAEAYKAARGRGRVAEKIRCGSLLLDAEAGVDSSLIRTEYGEIVGRNPGLRGWIGEQAPWLLKHYVSLMQYRRLAQEFREAHGLRDPHPATLLLSDDAAATFPQPARERLEEARKEAAALLASGATRTVKDFRAALARREWRRTG